MPRTCKNQGQDQGQVAGEMSSRARTCPRELQYCWHSTNDGYHKNINTVQILLSDIFMACYAKCMIH